MKADTPATPQLSTILDQTYYTLTSNLTSKEAQKFSKLQALVNENKTLGSGKQALYQNLLSRSQNTGDSGMMSKFLNLSSEYGPKFAQQALDLQKQFLPQFISTSVSALKEQAPEFYAVQSKLGQDVLGKVGQGLTSQQTDYFAQRALQQEQSAGISKTGLGAAQTARYLTTQDIAMQQQNTNNALAYLQGFSLLPGGGAQLLGSGGGQTAGAAAPTAAPSFTDLLNQQANLSALSYQTKATNSQANAQGVNSIFGSMLSAVGSIGAAAAL